MATQEQKLSLLRAFNASVRGEDEAPDDLETLELARPTSRAIELESIIMRKRRPVLAIQDGTATLQFNDPTDGTLWGPTLEKAKGLLTSVISAVGRVDLRRNADYLWVGTAWLIHENVLVTNRHVAEEFARFDGEGFVFQAGVGGDMEAAIDFLQEIDRPGTRSFDVRRVLYIEPRPGVDLAFLEVDQSSGGLAKPIALSTREPAKNPSVATIGYPAFDSRIPEPDLMAEIYGRIYDKKRLAPGAVTEFDDENLCHNCTTLGGNSGSVVVDLTNGEALGLHFSGSFLRTNYAVRADLVRQRLEGLLRGTLRSAPERKRSLATRHQQSVNSARPPHAANGSSDGSGSLVINLPLVVTVRVGDVQQAAVSALRSGGPIRSRSGADDGEADERDVEPEARATPADYADRRGYLANFIDDEMRVELPQVVKSATDVLTFDGGAHVLNYEHFSVVYNKRRRMCFFSACNIDGARSKSSQRKPWRFDPRIPSELQIMKECYGNAPKFSRGHMTRREDPAWGSTKAIQHGSDDSMHVTNVAPQMQGFNSPIWLELEDYALQNARQDRMKVSVFTGPYFGKRDPTMFGVRIPVKFWKVIAFIHDETGELCATGYEMSQKDNLEQPEFIFGQFTSSRLNVSTQVPIAEIEARAGISFDGLADIDPLAQEGLQPDGGPLTRFEQIRFF